MPNFNNLLVLIIELYVLFLGNFNAKIGKVTAIYM